MPTIQKQYYDDRVVETRLSTWQAGDMYAMDFACERILLILWSVFLLISWILLVIALALPSWVEGTEPSTVNQPVSVTREVGLFRQCDTYHINQQTNTENCFDVDLTDANVDAWIASAAFFIIGMILLTVTVILAFLSICFFAIIPWAKTLHSITNFFIIIAVIVFPVGFEDLDDPCPQSNSNEGACGLKCNGFGDMDEYSLCEPYGLGAASIVMIIAVFILFLCSLFACCVRASTVVLTREEVYDDDY